MRFRSGACVLLALTMALGACGSDPTTSDEYQALAEQTTAVEADLANAEAALAKTEASLAESELRADSETVRADEAEEALASEKAALSELRSQASANEANLATLTQQLADLDDDRQDWQLFTGVDTPYTYTSELFDTLVQTCITDINDPQMSEAECRCFIERLAQDVSLTDAMWMTEMYGMAESGAVDVDPLTGVPKGLDQDIVMTVGMCLLDCLES